jgi:hypothetical protein
MIPEDAERYARDLREQELRIEVMSAILEHIRATVDKMERDAEDGRKKATVDAARWAETMKWETRKFIVACALATVGLIGAGIGLANLFGWHR